MTLRTHGMLVAIIACSTVAGAQPPAGRDGPSPPGRGDTIRSALDTNGDHELDADEIKNASASLAKADKNGDGRIDHDEFRPPLGPPPRDQGGFHSPPPPRGGGPEGRPSRDGAMRDEVGPRPEGPSPERLVERAMTFDADGDGKLDRTELEKFAIEAVERMRGMMPARGMGPGAEGGGFRSADGPRRRPDVEGGGDRPERPRRPE